MTSGEVEKKGRKREALLSAGESGLLVRPTVLKKYTTAPGAAWHVNVSQKYIQNSKTGQ